MTDTFSPRLDRTAGSATLIGRTVVTNCVNAFAALRSAIETWEERKRLPQKRPLHRLLRRIDEPWRFH